MAVYGYARVSTDGQSLAAQLDELKTAKCEKKGEDQRRLLRSQATGQADSAACEGRCLGCRSAGSIGAIYTRSPEPARNNRGKEGRLQIAQRYLGRHRTAHGRLILTVLGGLAEFERELIRTGEGRERAKARGVILGRKPKLTGHQRREAIARREAGEVLTDIARSY